MTRFSSLLPALVAGLISSATARAQAPDCSLTCGSLGCSLEAARCYLEAGRPEAAKQLLKPLLDRNPDSSLLRLLLAKAYLGVGNLPWARRAAIGATELRPRDCEARSWLVWLHLQGAELEEASALLREQGCPDAPAMRVRWSLLEATLARYRNLGAETARSLEAARHQPEAHREDRELLSALEAEARPQAQAPLRARLDLGTGYTSNGLMSSPVDPAKKTALAAASPVVSADLRLELEPRWGWRLRPTLGLSLRSLILTAGAASDYTYLDLGLRPGLRAGSVGLFYAGQLFLLRGGDVYSGGDGPRFFYETHRAELEWEPRPWLSLWAGGGRSIFREQPRTRTELDAGLGLLGTVRGVRLLGGLSLRNHKSRHVAYDLWGGTLIGSVSRSVGPLWLRARLLLGLDGYPDSAGYFEADRSRRDLLLKAALEIWTRPWHGVRAGLSYELAERWSTASSYSYIDHRPLFRLSFSLDWDPWLPRVASPGAGHVAIPYRAAGAAGGLETERIQDLLRQEDAARRGSSCIN